MRKCFMVIALSTLFLSQVSFSAMSGENMVSDKHCDTIADACKSGGYTDEGMGDKSFWFGCMKPALLGKTVNGVTLDAKDVKECRKAKIATLKQEMHELQNVK